jgi:hypothetical protein
MSGNVEYTSRTVSQCQFLMESFHGRSKFLQNFEDDSLDQSYFVDTGESLGSFPTYCFVA